MSKEINERVTGKKKIKSIGLTTETKHWTYIDFREDKQYIYFHEGFKEL